MADPTKLFAGWLGDLPSDFAENFIAIGRWVQVERGQIIYRNGDTDTGLFGISDGVVRIQIAMNEHEQRVGQIIGPGFWFGGHAFSTGSPRKIEVEAATDAALLRVTPSDFEKLVTEFPVAWKWIATLFSHHLTLAMGAADDLMLSSSELRLAAVLLRFSGNRLGHPNSPPQNEILASQQELAVAANLSRASAGRILREMEKTGEVSIGYGTVEIRDAKALAARLS
jgi:CRP/FNR family transcriptional regulator, cyclic AMP receptor protein